ncbi:phosphoglycerate mutase-like protein [Stachybotrys elegans]|uniref:Phosphoglycerate mutase-like protein n=1 Tax=Stachybotrys elegans TaxID=80388 RepID=A0A8K0SGX6_9HYPO|nr:phosphoglycerate mutase-like protein [Stachybotrys elegans]
MRLLLIRHGETVDNVAQVYAGSRDSALTSHGVLQARRLASHLASRPDGLGLSVSHVFASDLQRAAKTAEIVAQALRADVLRVVTTPTLREKHFGNAEGVKFGAGMSQGEDVFAGAETAESMRLRVSAFIDDYLSPIWTQSSTCIVVAHGIILGALYRALCSRISPSSLTIAPEVQGRSATAPGMLSPSWRNTGYLEASLSLSTDHNGPVSSRLTMHVLQVNCTVHLVGLKRTGGGVGSAPFDEKQRTMDAFFSKAPKREGSGPAP